MARSEGCPNVSRVEGPATSERGRVAAEALAPRSGSASGAQSRLTDSRPPHSTALRRLSPCTAGKPTSTPDGSISREKKMPPHQPRSDVGGVARAGCRGRGMRARSNRVPRSATSCEYSAQGRTSPSVPAGSEIRRYLRGVAGRPVADGGARSSSALGISDVRGPATLTHPEYPEHPPERGSRARYAVKYQDCPGAGDALATGRGSPAALSPSRALRVATR